MLFNYPIPPDQPDTPQPDNKPELPPQWPHDPDNKPIWAMAPR